VSCDRRFAEAATALGHAFDGELKIGGNYLPVLRYGSTVYVSGQVPRAGSSVLVTGRVGEQVSLAQAQWGARICAMRALALLKRELGSLDQVRQILRVTVFTQSAQGFTQRSEVADAAAELLQSVLGPAGAHTRTSVGVFQLPKDASVELDLIAAAHS
jgi:enamine deaminase RidA (YjgF/YER057c/UK114 family)